MSATPESRPAAPRAYFSTFELLLLGVFAALVIAGNLALRLPIKVPGHSGIVWMALLVTARAVVPKPGSAAAAGVISGVLAAFAGLGDKGALDTFASYAAAGLAVDAAMLAARQPAGALRCACAGALGNLAKLAVKMLLELWIGIPTGFVVMGRVYPVVTHVVCGVGGGYLGHLVLVALRRAGFFAYLAGRR